MTFSFFPANILINKIYPGHKLLSVSKPLALVCHLPSPWLYVCRRHEFQHSVTTRKWSQVRTNHQTSPNIADPCFKVKWKQALGRSKFWVIRNLHRNCTVRFVLLTFSNVRHLLEMSCHFCCNCIFHCGDNWHFFDTLCTIHNSRWDNLWTSRGFARGKSQGPLFYP